MEKNILGSKIKALRSGKGYSQDHLAELSQISLRTVQRIENGETEARGDTLNRLAKALDVAIDLLTDVQPMTTAQADNKGYIALMNLSGLFCLFATIPFLGVLAPLTLWLIKKDSQPDVRESGKKILNYQITMALVSMLFFAVIIGSQLFHIHLPLPQGGLGAPELLLIIVASPPFINALFSIFNSARVLLGMEMKYWPAIKFFR